MRKSLTTIISFISLLILVAIQIYVIWNYYTVKSNNFDMIYSRAALFTLEQNDETFVSDPVDNELNELASSYLSLYSGNTKMFENKLVQNEIKQKVENILKNFDINSLRVKQYFTENKLDPVFKSQYVINEISVINSGKHIVVFNSIKNKLVNDKPKGLYIKSCNKEGNYYSIRYGYYIDCSKKFRLVISEISGLLALIIITLIIVIFAFTYTLLTLDRQKKLSDLKGDFIDNITHEFKTPISIISVAVSSLKQPLVNSNPDKFAELCNIMEKQNMFLSKMIDNVIDVSLLDRKTVNTYLHPVILKQYLHENIESYINNIALKKIIINEEFLIPDDYEYTLDPVQFTRVLNNLLSNSEKYCDNDPVINFRVVLGKQLKIELIDNGIGISEDQKESIFNKFYRINNNRNIKGLGLGLFIVKKIVENHKGSVQVANNSGVGTKFVILLPI